MTRLPGKAVLLLLSRFSLIACQPYRPSTSSLESEKAIVIHDASSSRTEGNLNVLSTRDDIDRVIIIARDTSTISESITSTTSTSTSSESPSTSSSDITTTSTSSASTSTSTLATSTTTTSTSSTSSASTQSTTSSTSTTSSSTKTTATSSATTTTASATNTTSAEIAEWNRKGNIAAVIFSCCLISLFSGVSILHCARDWAKSKRIAARELMNAKPVSAQPLVASRGGSTAGLIPDRSSIMFKDNPFGEQRPQTAYSVMGSPNNGWGGVSPAEQNTTTEGSTPVNGSSDRQHEPLV